MQMVSYSANVFDCIENIKIPRLAFKHRLYSVKVHIFSAIENSFEAFKVESAQLYV